MSRKEKCSSTLHQWSGILTEVLRQERIETKASKILMAYENHAEAVDTLQEGRKSIQNLIASNRGGATGMHGFIGERAQVYISNALSLAEGKGAHYLLLDDNGAVDYLRDGIRIQQKACNSGNMLGMDHIVRHDKMYPRFTPEGGIYQIPKDQYHNYLRYLNMESSIASKLRRSEFRTWKNIQAFTVAHPDITIEPMVVTYDEIQVGNIEGTLDNYKKQIDDKRDERIREAVNASRASLGEGVKVTAFSALLEGGVVGVLCFVGKTKQGTPLEKFSTEDWTDVGKTTAKSAGRGAVRGAATYILVNGIGIPGPFVSAGITTSFKITEDVMDYCSDKSSIEEVRDRVRCHAIEGAVSGGSTWAAMALCAKLIPIGGPCGKLIQMGAGLVGSYIGLKGISTIRSCAERSEDVECRRSS